MPGKPFGLIDTGAIVAMIDSKDRWHVPVIEAFETLRFPLATTAAVLAEVFHLLEGRRERAAAWTIIRSGAVSLMPIGDADLEDLQVLMQRYADRPMDFADATLVHLATRESLATILTIDHGDFETYRFGRGRRFRIVPERRPT